MAASEFFKLDIKLEPVVLKHVCYTRIKLSQTVDVFVSKIAPSETKWRLNDTSPAHENEPSVYKSNKGKRLIQA